MHMYYSKTHKQRKPIETTYDPIKSFVIGDTKTTQPVKLQVNCTDIQTHQDKHAFA